jgi:hypothetical protein
MPRLINTTASGMARITIGKARTARMDRRKASRPRKDVARKSVSGWRSDDVDSTSVITATMTLLIVPEIMPSELRKKRIVSKEKG